MLWFVFALLTAFFDSMKQVFSKKSLKHIDEYAAAWALRFFAVVLLLPLLLFIEIPALGDRFWVALAVSGTLNAVNTVLYMRAIKVSDLSMTIPMITFTPLFLLVTSPIMVGEFPDASGIIGIFLIVLGSYVLNIKEKSRGYLAPFRALLKQEGPRLMLIVAFIWSITANLDKIGLENSSPMFWIIALEGFMSLLLFPVMLHRSGQGIKQIRTNLRTLAPVGFSSALMRIFQILAISLTLVAYVISVKRMSIIMSVVIGCMVFREKGIKERLPGAIIMVLGVLFITLF